MKGRIYKIIHTQSNFVYVGSTKNKLSQRWAEHKNDFQRYLQGLGHKKYLYIHFKRYGISNFKMVLIKEYEVVDRKHLRAYEQLWIEKLNSNNNQAAFRIEALSTKYSSTLYRIKNREQIRESKKETCLCDCGLMQNKNHLARHKRTKIHYIRILFQYLPFCEFC